MIIEKIVIKQIILLVGALFVSIFLGSMNISSFDMIGFAPEFTDGIYAILYGIILFCPLVIIIIFYTPLACLYLMRMWSKKKTDNLHKFFRTINWIVIVLLCALFFLCISLLFAPFFDKHFFWYRNLCYYFFQIIIFSLAILATAMLFLWTNKTNKFLAKEIKDKEHFEIKHPYCLTTKELKQKKWYKILKVADAIVAIAIYALLLFKIGIFELKIIIALSLPPIFFYVSTILLLEEIIKLNIDEKIENKKEIKI